MAKNFTKTHNARTEPLFGDVLFGVAVVVCLSFRFKAYNKKLRKDALFWQEKRLGQWFLYYIQQRKKKNRERRECKTHTEFLETEVEDWRLELLPGREWRLSRAMNTLPSSLGLNSLETQDKKKDTVRHNNSYVTLNDSKKQRHQDIQHG